MSMKTIVTPLRHSDHEHAIVALWSSATVRQLAAIQSQLVQLFGGDIWLQQPPALHGTLMEIICDADYGDRSREQLFKEWYATHNQTVKEVLAGFAPFDITFTELLVSPRAIIVKAADPQPFNEIRKALLTKTTLPEGTKQPPEITHSTLARFHKAIDLEEAARRVASINVDITERITGFALVKDLGPPDFNGTPTQLYPLRISL
ncbi:MAG TPA: 2'-5' RNA ligase family protein [Candidatus Saccharimonadales bacterium]